MALLDEIGTMLAANGVGTLGTDLFIGDTPTYPDACVTVVETGGLGPTDLFGHDTLPAYENPNIQVLVRGEQETGTNTPYASARAKAQTAWNALTKVANESLSGTRYLRVSPLQSPFFVGRDESSRPIIVFNCSVQRVLV